MARSVSYLIAIFAVGFFVASAGGQVPRNVLERVLNVRVNAGTPKAATATALTVDVEGREYVITAKHVVAGLAEDSTIDVFIRNNCKTLHVKIFRCADPIDIAVSIPQIL